MHPQCSIDGCADSLLARGWCGKHYARWRRHGDPLVAVPSAGNTNALGYRHTLDARAKMSAAGRRRIVSPETRAKMSAARVGRVFSSETKAKISAAIKGNTNRPALPLGSTHAIGDYVNIKTVNGWELEHRAAMGLGPGDPRIVHHIDGNKAKNDRSNLQVFESGAAHSRHHRSQERDR